MSRLINPRTVFGAPLALAILLGTTGLAPEPHSKAPISADEFVQAMMTQRASVTDFYLSEGYNPNARAAQDRPLLLTATLQQDWDMVERLVEAGAIVDLADETGVTPLMAAAMHGKVDVIRQFVGLVSNVHAADRTGRTALHYAIGAQKADAVEMLLRVMPDLGPQAGDFLAGAIDSGSKTIIEMILQRLPPVIPEWTAGTRRALSAALDSGNQDEIRLLLKRHAVPPTPEGKSVPLLAYAIASHDVSLLTKLLMCGADPNTVLPDRCDSDFLALLPQKLCNYIDGDKEVTALMLAAGVGETDYVRALLDAGADKNRTTKRFKMIPLYLAAQTGKWQCAQVLLGSGPAPEQLRIEISLASQQVSVIKDGVPVFNTICSTGRSGFATRAGDYVITDKARSHRSTIYHVDMPYFMRLSCLDFGMHEGVVPNYPASHGCIRLPGDAAKKFFAEIPVGTLVTVK